jgi:hypothetical protein
MAGELRNDTTNVASMACPFGYQTPDGVHTRQQLFAPECLNPELRFTRIVLDNKHYTEL